MIWSVQKQPPVVFCKKGVLKNFSNFTGKHLCRSLFLIKLDAFRATILFKRDSTTGVFQQNLQNFRNTYLEEHLCTTASECSYNGGKILRNTSTSCEDCFLGAVKSDKKKKNVFYHWYETWNHLVVGGFGVFWVVVGGFGWFWVVKCFITNGALVLFANLNCMPAIWQFSFPHFS